MHCQPATGNLVLSVVVAIIWMLAVARVIRPIGGGAGPCLSRWQRFGAAGVVQPVSCRRFVAGDVLQWGRLDHRRVIGTFDPPCFLVAQRVKFMLPCAARQFAVILLQEAEQKINGARGHLDNVLDLIWVPYGA